MGLLLQTNHLVTVMQREHKDRRTQVQVQEMEKTQGSHGVEARGGQNHEPVGKGRKPKQLG